MQKLLFISFSIIVLTVLNYAILQKERIINRGEIVLLELAPVDPRSLMQGDYMALRYALEDNIPATDINQATQKGYMVVTTDANHVAHFERFHQQEPLAAQEKLLRYTAHGEDVIITPNAFFFQEGQAELYSQAKYGEFKFDAAGNHLLVGLADEHFKSLGTTR